MRYVFINEIGVNKKGREDSLPFLLGVAVYRAGGADGYAPGAA